MVERKSLEIGRVLQLKGCFTEEYFLRGLSCEQIGRELGYQPFRMAKGVFVAFALKLPAYHEFHLGGWAEHAADKFVEYRKNGRISYQLTRFNEVFDGKRLPISLEAAKRGWLQQMRHEKLVKVLPVVGDQEEKYRPGGKASQLIVVHPVQCMVTQFIRPGEKFRGIWA